MLLQVCPILHAFMNLIRRIEIIRRLPKLSDACPNYQTPAQIIRRLPKLSGACPNYQAPAQIIRRLPKLSDACPNGGSRAVAPPPPRPPKPEFKKKHWFCWHDYIKHNQPLKSEGEWCTGILKNKIKNLGIYRLFSFSFRAGGHRRFSECAEIRPRRLNRQSRIFIGWANERENIPSEC